MAIQRLSHIGICVSDLERSRAFYCQGLGFQEAGELEVEGAPVDTLLALLVGFFLIFVSLLLSSGVPFGFRLRPFALFLFFK